MNTVKEGLWNGRLAPQHTTFFVTRRIPVSSAVIEHKWINKIMYYHNKNIFFIYHIYRIKQVMHIQHLHFITPKKNNGVFKLDLLKPGQGQKCLN